MKSYELWMEGYVINGNRGTAQFLGCYTASSFRNAVLIYFDLEYLEKDELETDMIDIDTLSYWGCRIFDSEQEARKTFG